MISQLMQRFREHYNKVMELPGSPKKIAAGAAMGIVLDFLPVPVISIPLSFILAKLLRVNAVAAVVTVVLFKVAVPFFFAFNYMVGKLIIGDVSVSAMNAEYHMAGLGAWIGWVKHLGYPFLLGAVINAALAGTVAYFLVHNLLMCRRKRKKITPLKLTQPEKIR